MNLLLQIYEPVNQDFGMVWLALSIFIIGTVATVWLFRQKPIAGSSAYTGLAGMLVGFVALIALGTGIFGWLALAKNTTVTIDADKISFARQQIPFQNLKNAVIEESRQTSWINPNITKKSVQLLLIEDSRGKTYVLSEEHYPIKAIMQNLKAAVSKWEATSN